MAAAAAFLPHNRNCKCLLHIPHSDMREELCPTACSKGLQTSSLFSVFSCCSNEWAHQLNVSSAWRFSLAYSFFYWTVQWYNQYVFKPMCSVWHQEDKQCNLCAVPEIYWGFSFVQLARAICRHQYRGRDAHNSFMQQWWELNQQLLLQTSAYHVYGWGFYCLLLISHLGVVTDICISNQEISVLSLQNSNKIYHIKHYISYFAVMVL